jgi:hypothetical protein
MQKGIIKTERSKLALTKLPIMASLTQTTLYKEVVVPYETPNPPLTTLFVNPISAVTSVVVLVSILAIYILPHLPHVNGPKHSLQPVSKQV